MKKKATHRQIVDGLIGVRNIRLSKALQGAISLAHNERLLTPVVDTLAALEHKLRADAFGDMKEEDGTPQARKFLEAQLALMQTEIEVEIYEFPMSHLNLEVNEEKVAEHLGKILWLITDGVPK